MNLIDKDALLTAIDKERQILIEQERLGAEHVVVHHARRLVEDTDSLLFISAMVSVMSTERATTCFAGMILIERFNSAIFPKQTKVE